MRDMDSTHATKGTILSEYQCIVCIVGIGVGVLVGFGIARASGVTIRSSAPYSYQLLNV